MIGFLRFPLAAAVVAFGFVVQAPSAGAQSANEKLYAELAKLPADQRAAKILEGAKKEGKVEALSANFGVRWRPNDLQWEQRFPGIKFNKVGLASSAIADRIIAEETAGKHLTDVGVLSSVDTVLLTSRDLLASFPTPLTDRILPKYRGFLNQFPNNVWNPISMTTHGMAYNFKIMSEDQVPKGWFDLCKPQYKGQASYEVLEVRLLTAWYTMLGEDKAKELIKCIGENSPILQQAHTGRFELMTAGDHPLSGDILLNHVYTQQHEQPAKNSIKPIFTAPVLADAFGVVINKNAPDPHAAALFADWELSEDTQGHFVKLYYDPLTGPSPYTPASAEVVLFGPIYQAIVTRLVAFWKENVSQKNSRGR